MYLEGYTENRFLEDSKRVKRFSDQFRKPQGSSSLGESESIEIISKYRDDYRKG